MEDLLMRFSRHISAKRPLSAVLIFVLLITCLTACDQVFDLLNPTQSSDTHTTQPTNRPTTNPQNSQNPPAGTTLPQSTTLSHSLLGLTITLPNDYKKSELSNGESSVFINSDNVVLTIVYRVALSHIVDSASFAQYYVDFYADQGFTISVDTANGISYAITDFNDGTMEVRSFYVSGTHCWTIYFTIPGTTFDPQLITYATTCQLDSNHFPSSPDAPTPPPVTPTEPTQKVTVTVHTLVPSSWGSPNCWAWKDGGSNVFDAWPGAAMTKAGTYYYVEMASWADRVIINGNNGGIQTADIPIEAGRDIWIIVHKDGSYYSVFYTEPTAAELADCGY